ncbi:NAD(P)/FAD-dependent oxidoreductase [Euzebyella marina]|uniref:NAD(P)/FAD-dependent oxidoreductase n=1 Tax=Euzebyella marina TaxID=1761453 RepID=A0A3G2L704_9FLAO|nr:NAD(P)/FAD-dependent oxidoreductase [Euzebyella marina]AYN67963.1 NAD(P)/FAD-dependent oxidoreductase [Euzebyella marina]
MTEKNSTISTQKQPQNKNYDAIIIGSGAGGLACAICLAREGKKVLVLEQHDVPGGWCHSFYLNGHRFTPGVHYVGRLAEGQTTNDLYRGLGIANDLVFFRMNPDGYEHVKIGDHQFDYPDNFDELIHRLSEQFPEEEKNISKYLKLTRTVSRELYSIPYFKGFWQKLIMPYKTKYFGKYALFSLSRVIGWHIKNPLLKKILNIQCGDHGVAPNKVPFLLHSAVMYHYIHGAYYPMGGGGALIKSMTKVIKKYEGEIRTSTAVNKILLEGDKRKKAVGVVLDNDEKIYAKYIISNADVGITYNQLIGKENLSKRLNRKLEKTTYSCTSIMLFLTVDMDLRKHGVDSGNIWLMPDRGPNDFYEEIFADRIDEGDAFEGMFISCTTLKDPSSYDGKHHTIEAITFVDYKTFEKFDQKNQERSQEYLRLKERLTQKMVNGIDRAVPGIKKHIVHKELGTPLTNEYYINSTKGNVYGTEKSMMHIGPFAFRAKSEIENLYLCGSSVLSHGVAGASHSGVDTAARILGCTSDELKKPQEDQHIRLYEAEDSSAYPDWLKKKIASKQSKRKKASVEAAN